jgi:hypothetical protein
MPNSAAVHVKDFGKYTPQLTVKNKFGLIELPADVNLISKMLVVVRV